VQVLLTIILGDSDWFEVLGVGLVGDAGGEGWETVAVVVVVAPAGTVPSPRFNNKPRVAAFVDLLPEVDRGGVVKVGLKWILALMPCAPLVARGLLYFLFIVVMRGRVALVALVVVIPPTPMVLRPRGLIPSGRYWMLPIELHERALGQVLQPLYMRIG
jgi:hypothetical protein